MSLSLEYKQLLVELRFIKEIPSGMVIDTSNHVFQNPDSWTSSISRFIGGQSREVTATWLSDVLNLVDSKLRNLKEFEQKSLLKALAESKPGYRNIMETYKKKGDIYLSCRLESFMDEIDELLRTHHYLTSRLPRQQRPQQQQRRQPVPQEDVVIGEEQYYDD